MGPRTPKNTTTTTTTNSNDPPPSHPQESDPLHRSFLSRSLSRNDTELAALQKLTLTLSQTKSLILSEYGQDVLLDIGEGIIGIHSITDKFYDTRKDSKKEDERLEFLVRDFTSRLYLRRRLLNRLSRRLNRVSTAMDGHNVNPPPAPKYGDERFVIQQEKMEEFWEECLEKKEALDRVQKRRMEEKRRIMGGMREREEGEKERVEHLKKYESDEEEGEKMEVEEDSPAKKEEGTEKEEVAPPTTSSSPIRAEENETTPKYSEEEDFKTLTEYDVGYDKLIYPFSTTTITSSSKSPIKYTLAQEALLNPNLSPNGENIKYGCGIGATHRTMSGREKEAEWKRWSNDILGRMVVQPTFEELGMGKGFVFEKERRRKRCRVEMEEERKKKRNVEDEKGDDRVEESEKEKEKSESEEEEESTGSEADNEEEDDDDEDEEENDDENDEVENKEEKEKEEEKTEEKARKKDEGKVLKKKQSFDSGTAEEADEPFPSSNNDDEKAEKDSDMEDAEKKDAEDKQSDDEKDKVEKMEVDESTDNEHKDTSSDDDEEGEIKDEVPATTEDTTTGVDKMDEDENEESTESEDSDEEGEIKEDASEKKETSDSSSEEEVDSETGKKNEKAKDEEDASSSDSDDGDDEGEKDVTKNKEKPKKSEEKQPKKSTPPKKIKPFSLAPIPSFHEQDTRRIRLLHSNLLTTSMHEHARKKISDATNDYNLAFRKATDLLNQRTKTQGVLNKMIYEHRLALNKKKQDHALEVAFARAKWLKRKEVWEAQRRQRRAATAGYRPGIPTNNPLDAKTIVRNTMTELVDRVVTLQAPAQLAIGTPLTASATNRTDPILSSVATSLGYVIDAVVLRDKNGLGSTVGGGGGGSVDNEKFEAFVPPPPPSSTDPDAAGNVIVDPATGETLSQRHERMENDIRKEITSITTQLQNAEEERRRAWKKMLKVKSEFGEAHLPSGSGGRKKNTQVDLTAMQQLPAPPLKGVGGITASNYAASIPLPGYSRSAARTTTTTTSSSTTKKPPSTSSTPAASSSSTRPVSTSKYSAEKVKARIYSDGSVMPVTMPKKNSDGTYQRPAGRRRKGMDWDAVRGRWTPSASAAGGGGDGGWD